MKRSYLIFLLAGLFLAACESSSDGYTISGQLEGDLAEGTPLYLKRVNEQNRPVNVDTVLLSNNSFEFKGEAGIPEMHYIFVDKINGNIPVVLESGKIEVKAHKDSLAFADIGGTPQNEKFADFLENSRALSSQVRTMNQDLRIASAARDTATMTALRDEYFELQEKAKRFEMQFAKDNPDALISVMILDKILMTKALPEAEVKEMFDALSPELRETRMARKISESLTNNAKTAIGAIAPNFTAPTPGGTELSLNEVLGKVTIIDFWAAWCKPCRIENPNLVRIYNAYHDKGLEILGVSLDRKAEDWKKAIEDDGLIWHHVSNVQYFDAIARLYNVKSIPASFILDENGVIVAKNLRGAAMEAKIAELLP